ncbi:MAG: NUDIX domain-containing protein [Candidatus Magasanikbacteria bacterium]|nr:NUDIX domain-containing protein [Candidatus Magasanikbacteria bacterium]
MEKTYSGGFLFNPKTQSVLLHQRDEKAAVNPNKWAFFGGLNEGDETPQQGFIRELFEEIGLVVESEEVLLLRDYLNEELSTYRYVFYVESVVSVGDLVLGEGRGFDWIALSELSRYDLTEKTQEDLEYFKNTIK